MVFSSHFFRGRRAPGSSGGAIAQARKQGFIFGRRIEPAKQIRGGIVQGLGGALLEHCIYDAAGQLTNGTMADYLVPMAGEMPDMEIDHVVTMTESSELGAKGAGEAGTAGAPAAVLNALNDALAPLGARVAAQPFTPERILKALGRV